MSNQLTQEDFDDLFAWVDTIPLSKPKKYAINDLRNINRDFSDCLLMAETINQFYPKLIDLHNYPSTNSVKNKLQNWQTLNTKVLSKLGISLKKEDLQKLASATPMAIQSLLFQFKKVCESDGHVYKSAKKKDFGIEENYPNREEEESKVFGKMGGTLNENRKSLESMKVSKAEELREILKLIKEKITTTEKSIKRKDTEIKELEDIIHLGI